MRSTSIRSEGKAGDIALKVQDAVSEIVQTSVGMMVSSGRGDMGSDGAYVGCMGGLGAIIPTAMLFANKPKLTKDEVQEKGREVALALVTAESVLFACLVTSHVLTEFKPNGEVTTEMGPHVLYAALLDWEKLTGKRAEDYLDPKMVVAARNAKDSIEFIRATQRAGSVPNVSSTLN